MVADTPFDVDVFVSGFASRLTGVGFNTRAGKAFLRLAKSAFSLFALRFCSCRGFSGFASLPKLPVAGLNPSTDDLTLGAPSSRIPEEISDESDIEMLDDKLRQLRFDTRDGDAYALPPSSHGSRTPSSASASSYDPPQIDDTMDSPAPPMATSELQQWHANLEKRLHPFWSSVLSNRTVRVSLYVADPTLYEADSQRTDESGSSESSVPPEKRPIVVREVTTAVDGSFQLKFSVPWERLCTHPAGVHVAFGGSGLEHELFVVAEMLAPPSPASSTTYTPYQPQQRQAALAPPPATVAASIPIPLTYSAVRVISDIDDTVKLSGILSGARAVFRNVFVHDLRDSVIRGMGEWYLGMWKRGVRFHYVVSFTSQELRHTSAHFPLPTVKRAV